MLANCSVTADETITLLSPQRIEGVSQGIDPPPSGKEDDCPVPGTTRSHFVLFSKN
jgi:hypothetical protein